MACGRGQVSVHCIYCMNICLQSFHCFNTKKQCLCRIIKQHPKLCSSDGLFCFWKCEKIVKLFAGTRLCVLLYFVNCKKWIWVEYWKKKKRETSKYSLSQVNFWHIWATAEQHKHQQQLDALSTIEKKNMFGQRRYLKIFGMHALNLVQFQSFCFCVRRSFIVMNTVVSAHNESLILQFFL